VGFKRGAGGSKITYSSGKNQQKPGGAKDRRVEGQQQGAAGRGKEKATTGAPLEVKKKGGTTGPEPGKRKSVESREGGKRVCRGGKTEDGGKNHVSTIGKAARRSNFEKGLNASNVWRKGGHKKRRFEKKKVLCKREALLRGTHTKEKKNCALPLWGWGKKTKRTTGDCEENLTTQTTGPHGVGKKNQRKNPASLKGGGKKRNGVAEVGKGEKAWGD